MQKELSLADDDDEKGSSNNMYDVGDKAIWSRGTIQIFDLTSRFFAITARIGGEMIYLNAIINHSGKERGAIK